jgi:hypothetical protein
MANKIFIKCPDGQILDTGIDTDNPTPDQIPMLRQWGLYAVYDEEDIYDDPSTYGE